MKKSLSRCFQNKALINLLQEKSQNQFLLFVSFWLSPKNFPRYGFFNLRFFILSLTPSYLIPLSQISLILMGNLKSGDSQNFKFFFFFKNKMSISDHARFFVLHLFPIQNSNFKAKRFRIFPRNENQNQIQVYPKPSLTYKFCENEAPAK